MKNENVEATQSAVKYAEQNWRNFIKVTQACGIAICITLIIMAITLV